MEKMDETIFPNEVRESVASSSSIVAAYYNRVEERFYTLSEGESVPSGEEWEEVDLTPPLTDEEIAADRYQPEYLNGLSYAKWDGVNYSWE